MGITERKTRQKQALRERILDAARRIVIREGFAALSMRKIADAIEYSPATLYLHFESRDEIARALCAEGYEQLLASFEPLAQIADPAERLKALARAYIAFGVAHPQTYRLIFMEDPTYMSAALYSGGHGDKGSGKQPDSGAAGAAEGQAGGKLDDPSGQHGQQATKDDANEGARLINPAAGDESSDAAMRLMVGSLEELRAAGRLPASMDGAVWAQALWATMHGIVALNLTCPVFPTAPLETVIDAALEAWFGAREPMAQAAPASPVAEASTGPAAPSRPTRARRPAAKPKAVGA
ncbi:MAG: TetR/AcrR family transcriptional regulator [Paraburkholderia sp.]|uniref:TetR/AcrR family transcriptional regulator n=1 Tax=Burkholderiaceae TaxID=119060 RepID=UPI0010F85A47|nr:TetR/AcrR family transcriptional regulator [Burkholderia sp. 4M9327F10]